MNTHRDSALLITRASSGSIVIEGALTATALWLVKESIGEVIKRMLKSSKLRKYFLKLLETYLPAKAAELAGRIQDKLSMSLKSYHPKITSTITEDNRAITITIVITPGMAASLPPTYGSIPSLLLSAGSIFCETLQDGSQDPDMVVIPPGSFEMGDIWGDGYEHEKPVHTVQICSPFAIGRYPVTFDEYDTFAQATGRQLPDDRGWGRGRRPVINVSWVDAVAYADWLTKQTGKCYRLPTEAEWEYAARCGGKDEKWAGTSSKEKLDDYAWYDKNSYGMSHPVGEKKPNGLGLYDMSGNIWEWCQDWYGNYSEETVTDPVGPDSGSYRVLRGCSWFGLGRFCRAVYRGWDSPVDRNDSIGFRLARG
jgi:formylglycine-generating enzyme required for sulfatase activity